MATARPDVAVIAEQLRRRVPGGIGTYIRGLLQGLGPDPSVALVASRASGRPDELAALGAAVRASVLPGPLLTRCWDAGWNVGLPSASVVHGTALATPYPRRTPVTVMVHDLAWREVPEAFPPRGRRWHEAALGRCLRKATVVLAPSERTAAMLRQAGATAVEVIEEGCDHLPPPDRAGAARLLEANGVTGPYLLSVSTLEPRKNLPRLLEAYAAARSELPDPWPLVVVGPAGWGAHLVPTPGVHLVGSAEPAVLAGLYEGARCLAYVPLVEGWGLPAVEAMRAGTAVVASPMPSTGGAALEVDPTDAAAIADALVTAATDDAERGRLVAAGRTRAAGLTWADAAARHRAVWERLA